MGTFKAKSIIDTVTRWVEFNFDMQYCWTLCPASYFWKENPHSSFQLALPLESNQSCGRCCHWTISGFWSFCPKDLFKLSIKESWNLCFYFGILRNDLEIELEVSIIRHIGTLSNQQVFNKDINRRRGSLLFYITYIFLQYCSHQVPKLWSIYKPVLQNFVKKAYF